MSLKYSGNPSDLLKPLDGTGIEGNKPFITLKSIHMTLVKVNNQQLPKSFSGLVDEFLFYPMNKCFRDDLLSADPWVSFPPVNIRENKENYQIELVAPGLSKEDFRIGIEGDILSISSEKKEEKVSEDQKQVRREFQFRSFKRSFTLNESVETEKIQARYENGILHLTLPKKAEQVPSTKEISVE